MRKLLSILALLLFTTGAWAFKTVTWDQNVIRNVWVDGDHMVENNSVGGITVTASDGARFQSGNICAENGRELYFSSSTGQFLGIQIYAQHYTLNGASTGWSIMEENGEQFALWTVSETVQPSYNVTLSGEMVDFYEISKIVFVILGVDYTVTPFTGTYDGEAHGIIISAGDDATVKYGTTEGNYNLNASPTYTEVGTYTVYYQVSEDGMTETGSSVVDIWPVGTLLSENFEYCGSALPTGWETETVDYEGYQWVVGAGDANSNYNTTHSGCQNVYFNYEGRNNCKLTSPQFTVPSGYNAARLNFWYINRKYSGDIDELKVYYRTEAGGTLTQLDDITGNHESWTYATYLLPDNACQVVFEIVGHFGHSIGIDDVQIVSVNAYDITYNLNGGTVATANPTEYDTTSEFTLTNPTKTGYDFLGWTGSNGTTPQTTVTIAAGSTGDREYTANWQATVYTITYNLDGGSADNPASYTIESNDITLTAPTKSGFTFLGWTGSNGTEPETTVTIVAGSTGNKTYTANWQANAVILADGTEYTRTADEVVGGATYKKTLDEEKVGKYQAWLVPFDYTLTADDLEKFAFYKINMIANSPDPETEATDEMWVFVKKLQAGDVLHGNMPYVYKPLEAVTDYEFTTDGATLKAKNTGVLMKTETAEDVYSFYASYGSTAATADAPFYYVANDGTICYGDNVTLGSLRWFIRKTNKYGDTPTYARQMHFFDGESSEATGISTAKTATEITGEWYTLDGRRIVGKPVKSGIYVSGGRKVVIK